MARGQGKDKNKNTTYFNIAMLTDGLEASVKRVMSLFNKMVRGVNSSLSKLGQINNPSFKMQSSSARYGSRDNRNLSADRQISATSGRDTRTVEEFYSQETKIRDDLIKEYKDTLETYNKELSSITIPKKDGGIGRARAGFRNRKKELVDDIKQIKELIDLTKKEYIAKEDKFLLSRPYNKTQIYDTGAKKGTKQVQSESWGTGIMGTTTSGKKVELMSGKDVILETYHDTKKNLDVIKQKTIEWQDIETSIGIQRVKTNEIITDNIEEQEKKQGGFFNTLFKRFKSVAIYRGIRNFLKTLVESITQTVAGIASVNSGFKDTMSNVTSSIEMLKASGAVALYGLLESAEPIIRGVANVVAELANSFSLLIAQLTGAAEYTKINLDYMQEYQAAANGALLSFDTFTTMSSSGGVDYSKMLSTEKVGEASNRLKAIEALLWSIAAAVAAIGAAKTLKNISKLGELFSGWQGTLGLIAGAIVLAVGAFSQLSNIWGDLSASEKALSIMSGIAAAALLIAFAFKATHNWGKALAIGVAGGAVVAAGMASISKSQQMKAYETGGSYARGDIFRANEFGKTELVASSSSGGAVMNMQQLESAVHNGVASAMSANGGGDAVIELDGNKVGRYIAGNAGFRATANKRNTGLNWR